MRRSTEQLKIKIGKHELPVVVTGDGEFWAEWEGTSFRSTTFKGLRAKLLPKVRDDAKRCSIAALRDGHGDEWEAITLIGFHGDNGNVLFVDAEGKTQQLHKHDTRIYHPFTPHEMRAYRHLAAQVKTAEKILKEWLKERRLSPGPAVRAAIGLPPEKVEDDDDDDW